MGNKNSNLQEDPADKKPSNHDKTLLVGQYVVDIGDAGAEDQPVIGEKTRGVVAQTTRSVVQLYRNKTLTLTGVAVEIVSTANKSTHAVLLPHFTALCSPDPVEGGDVFELSLCHQPGAITFPLHLEAVQSFTCPILDVALIWLDNGCIQSLQEHQCSFLRLDCSALLQVPPEAEVFLVSGCGNSSTVKFASGQAKEYYGLQLKFNMPQCDFAVAGLPLVTADGTLVATYKYTMCIDDVTTSTAAAVAHAVPMAVALVDRPMECGCHLLSNPVNLSPYGTALNGGHDGWENGIGVCTVERDRYSSTLLYTSPSSPYVTPIWYAPTFLGWYWTPNDPARDEEPNWMAVSRLAVVGGIWNKQIPAKKNVQIISWLQDNNIACGAISVA